jgi:hypothetical protein
MTGPAGTDEDRRAQYIGLGCFSAFAGLFSGGMILVLVAKFVGIFRRCTPPEGLPACDWHVYALAGMILGAVSLPILVLRRVRRRGAAADTKTERG